MQPPPTSDAPAAAAAPQSLASYSNARRYTLLLIFCLAQFLDSFNNSFMFCAIPSMTAALDIAESESVWIISAFQLTFASFLLISGRLSDVYNPKYVFICGLFGLGVFSLGAGFVHDKIALFVLRAFNGIAAAMTIPSALTLIVNIFPEPAEQARAIGAFAGCGSLGAIIGFIIGAILVQYASWPWVFWFLAIVAIPLGGICMLVIPPQPPKLDENGDRLHGRWKTLDMVGVSILTVAVVLFIFAITSGTTAGWGSAMVVAPLVISVFMVVGFFLYERMIPAERAAMPPSTWFLPNFAVLFATALFPFIWYNTVFTGFTVLWQDIYHWSVISTAVHMIPIGVMAFVFSFTGPAARFVDPKWLILFGEVLCMGSCVLFAFADGASRYWPYVFPGFLIGSTGGIIAYTHTNIAIFRTSPPSMAGTVGAVFNGALQLGSAVGISAVSSIQVSVEQTHGGKTSYAGRAAGFWFLLAVIGAEAIALLIFYRTGVAMHADQPTGKSAGSASSSLADTEKATGARKGKADSSGSVHRVPSAENIELARRSGSRTSGVYDGSQ